MTRLVVVELRQLEHFVAVAEEQSFTRAAQRLSYVQSALSVSIQSLERELGIRLFDRTTHRVVLTDAGESLLEPAKRTLDSVEDARDAVAAVKGVIRGTLRIGIMQSFRFLDVPDLLGRFHREHPGVEIRTRPAAGGSASLLEQLRNGDLDMVFAALTDAVPAELSVTPLAFEEIVFVSNEELARPGEGPLPLRDLAEETFVDFPVGWGVRTVIDRAFTDEGVNRRITIESADVATSLQLVQSGLGVALIPPSLVSPTDQGLRTRTLEPRIGWHVAMVTPKTRVSNAARAFIEIVLSTIG